MFLSLFIITQILSESNFDSKAEVTTLDTNRQPFIIYLGPIYQNTNFSVGFKKNNIKIVKHRKSIAFDRRIFTVNLKYILSLECPELDYWRKYSTFSRSHLRKIQNEPKNSFELKT